MAFVLTLEGDGPVRKAIESLDITPDDLLPVRKDVGEEMLLRTFDHFATSTSPDGEHWPESQRVALHGGETLVDHGDLRDSVHYDPDARGDLDLYSDDDRARIHTEGGTSTPTNGKFPVFRG